MRLLTTRKLDELEALLDSALSIKVPVDQHLPLGTVKYLEDCMEISDIQALVNEVRAARAKQAAAPSRAERFARECGPFRWRGEGFGCVVVAGDNDPICDCTFRNVAHDMVQDDYAEAIAAALNALGGHEQKGGA
jgi:hypothetical protein